MSAVPQPPFPFFVGCGRSGTTLLRSIFDSHPDLAVMHESRFVVSLAKRAGRYRSGPDFDAAAFTADLAGLPIGQSRFAELGIPAAEVAQLLRAGRVGDVAEAIRTVFARYAEAEGKRRYGDKTPTYVVDLPLIAALLPEARFVHLIRDGRDVALAYRDAHFGPAGLDAAAVFWANRVRAGRRAGAALGPGRYHEVRYEDVVADPEPVVRSLCDFLELDFHPAMLRYPERAGALVASTGHQQHHRHLHRPPVAGLRDWRTQLPVSTAVVFDLVARDLLAELGYPPAPPVSAAERRAARLRLARARVAEWSRLRRLSVRRTVRILQARRPAG